MQQWNKLLTNRQCYNVAAVMRCRIMPKGIFIPFSESQKQFICDNYLTMPVKRVAAETNSTYGRIMRFLKKNNLELPIEIIAQRKFESQRKKGDESWNKGKKQSDYMNQEAIDRTKKTRFKKGNEPHNTKKEGDGAISIRKDKSGRSYKYIRIKKGVWELYHRVVWQQINGKIPSGHVIVFKDDNPENVTIENLEMITMTENMFRNSKHNYPEEIIPSMVLKKKIETKIKKLQNG